MATDNFKPLQAQNFSLAGAGAVIGDTSITLKSFLTIDGALITMSMLGTIAFITLEPGNGTLEEQISFTGVNQNANGTATLTGVSHVTFEDPYTTTSGLAKTHAGSTTAVLSNTSGFYNQLDSKNDDATITGLYSFTQNPQKLGVLIPTLPQEYATKQYVDNSSTGTTTVNGLLVSGVLGEAGIKGSMLYLLTDGKWYNADSSTKSKSVAVKLGIPQSTGITGSTVNILIEGQDQNQVGLAAGTTYYLSTSGTISTTKGTNIREIGRASSATTLLFEDETQDTNVQTVDGQRTSATDTGTANTYAITLTPTISAYTQGQIFSFKAANTNTTTSTLNVNGLGAIAIKNSTLAALSASDIIAGLIVEVEYDGTNFQMLSNGGNGVLSPVSPIVAYNYQDFTSSGTWTKPAGLAGTEFVKVQAWGGGGGGGNSTGSTDGSGGGGGGAYSEAIFRASDLGSTVTVTIGNGGTSGVVGGNTTFGTLLTAFGGGAGGAGSGANGGGGGGGGGVITVGSNGANNSAGTGGDPLGGASSGNMSTFGGGAGGSPNQLGSASVYGGAGGGGGGSGAAGRNGASSLYGGAGGGGGAVSGQSAGAGGNAVTGYSGAAGAGGVNSGNGVAGAQPAAGGGGAGAGSATTGGAGGKGECRVWVVL